MKNAEDIHKNMLCLHALTYTHTNSCSVSVYLRSYTEKFTWQKCHCSFP